MEDSNIIGNNKKAKIAFIIFLMFSAIMYFLAFGVTSIIPYLNEDTTIELSANVTFVEWKDSSLCVIHTREYGDKLHVLQTYIANINEIGKIQESEIITFRVTKSDAQDLNELTFIAPVTLRTSDAYIITFESYNKVIDMSKNGARLSGTVFGTIFLLISVYCFLKMKNIRIFKSRN